ncbi:maleylpyruvate isomerase family mycothiol-dependent enzyme [Streptomyces sp. NPDC049813]|uniref:maleylpyruvate isomerase family mycothiol-dependent enzyme n=1 Tax=Streptomyces sp. NPDC049813 TaxID=3365597 RepID=UPI0037B723CF
MTVSLEFPTLLRLLDERSAAFRSAVTAAPSLDAPVPSCPGWTVLDLVRHLGTGQRWWAAIVAAGPAGAPPAKEVAEVPRGTEALLSWYADAHELLLRALRAVGPERACWTWWSAGVSPANAWGVARRRVHEVLVHTYDAQLAAGAVRPMPADVALDGVAEFLDTCNSTPVAWPHEAATVQYHATEGRSWLLTLDSTGAWPAPLTDDAAPASVSATGTAEQLLLFVWGRRTLRDLRTEGDQRVFEQLIAWEPEE